MYVGNALISLRCEEIVQISVHERALWAGWGWSTASQRETVPFNGNLHSSPSSAPCGLRTLQGQSVPQCLAGTGVFADVAPVARRDCSTCVVTLPAPQASRVSNFCPFPLPQGLPSPRFRNRDPAASHSAAHLLKNRYSGTARCCSRK